MGVSTLYLMIALAIHGASGAPPNKPDLTITSAAAFDDAASDVTLTCVTVTTGVTYSMTRDGTALTANDGFTATTGILIIGTFDTATDTGIYKCKATKGSEESESDPLTVKVQNAPADPTLAFKTPEKFVIGDDVKLTCTSARSAEFEWYHGANKVTPAQTGAELTLTSYAATNNGDYKCRGLTADTTPLYSIYSNVLTLAPVECTTDNHCTGKGDKTKCDTSTNMCVECLAKADCGSKGAKDQCDVADTKTCVAFIAKIQQNNNDVSSVQVKGLSSLDLTCKAGPSTNPLTYAWTEAGANVGRSAALQISNPSTKAGKKYKCKATKAEDANGPVATSTAEVTLTDELNVVIKKDDASGGIVSGKNVDLKGLNKLTLFCEAGPKTGTVAYKWKDGKGDVLSGGDYDISPGTLVIKKLDNKAGKKIECEATDDGSNAEGKSAKVTLIKSGSTNLQMSYLMLGLVTLVSAVWSGRV